MKSDILSLEKEKTRLEESVSQYKSVIDSFADYMASQNDAVVELETISKKQEDNLKKAEEEADKLEEKYKTKIRLLLQESVPDNCNGSYNWLLNKSIEGEFKWSN